METVGFIGLGKMGTPMAVNIQKAGYPMVVYDIREAAARPLLEGGARLAASAAEVARLSDAIFTSLPRPQEVEQAATGPGGILEGIGRGKTYLDLSTCGPDLIRGLEPLFRQKGAHVLDTPVLSSPIDAVERGVLVMVGGERRVYERIRPILDAFADKVVYAGSLGSACVCKLVHNMMSLVVQEVVAEGLTLGVKAGVELPVLLDSGSRGIVGSMRERLAPTVFRGQFEPPIFTLALARKDVGLATELGRKSNVPLPVGNLVEQIMVQAMNRGWGERDRTVAFLLQEESAGVEVRAGELAS
jgi:3-hydroxyisobutyrate dehydrogenase